MGTCYFTVPHAVELTSERGWNTLGAQGRSAASTHFFVARYHLVVEQKPVGEIYLGERLASHSCPKGNTLVVSDTHTSETSRVDLSETVLHAVCESTLTSRLATKVNGDVGVKDVWALRSEMSNELAASVKTSLGETQIKRSLQTKAHRHEWKIEFRIGEDEDAEIEVHPAYQRVRNRVYLGYSEYLVVTYRKSPLGIRKYRKKWPTSQHARGKKRPNVIPSGEPLFDFFEWQELPGSCHLVRSSERSERRYVEDPTEAEVRDISPAERQSAIKTYYSQRRLREPTLYQAAEAAFPIRWVRRNGGDWSREDLLKIEANEDRDVETQWIFQSDREIC